MRLSAGAEVKGVSLLHVALVLMTVTIFVLGMAIVEQQKTIDTLIQDHKETLRVQGQILGDIQEIRRMLR